MRAIRSASFSSNRVTDSNICLASVSESDSWTDSFIFESPEHQQPCPESLKSHEQLRTFTLREQCKNKTGVN